MNCAVTLTADEFKQVHNALCSLRSVRETLEGVVREPITDKLAKAIDDMYKGLQGAYEQERNDFSRKSKHYDDVKAQLALKNSEWSIYEVGDLSERHPYEGARKVVYKDHWGEHPVECRINGLTWAALWTAADACIRDSRDSHHVFIERFRVSKEDPTVLYLVTGS